MKLQSIFVTLFLPFITSAVFAQTSWQIKTPMDNFTIEVINGSTGRIGGKEVSLKPFAKFSKILTSKNFAVECIVPKKRAPIAITQTRGADTRTWQLFPDEAVFYDGANCLLVEGEGVYEFPLHRQWFLGQGKGSIDLGTRFTLIIGDDKLTFVADDNGKWRNADAEQTTNWTLIDNFVNAAKDFEVAHRTTQKPPPGSDSFVLKTARKSYRFHRIGSDWGIELENPKWLALTPTFRFITEMSKSAWQNEGNSDLALLKKKDAPTEERIDAMKKLAVKWNEDIKRACHDIVLSQDEGTEIKRHAAQILKSHPTDDSIIALARALKKTDDPELLYVISNALRVRNPKGSRISTTDQPDDVEAKIQEWQKWANELQAVSKK
jgi:hypothetical protein